MKNIFILLISLQFSLVCYSQHHTRDYITLVASNRDTAGTIFGHIFWHADTKILFHLPPEDSLYNSSYPDIPLTVEHIYCDSSRVLLRFPGKNWIRPVEDERRRFSTNSISTHQKNDIFGPDPYYMRGINLRLNLFGLFNTYPGIFEELKTGTLLEIQASMYLQADSLPFEWIYSNIDTIYLPPATPDDIAAFYYLRSKDVDFPDFFWFFDCRELSLLQWEYVRDNFKNSIISEYASNHVLQYKYDEIRGQGNPYSMEEFNQLRIIHWKKLRNSKSEIVADWAKQLLWDKYHITD